MESEAMKREQTNFKLPRAIKMFVKMNADASGVSLQDYLEELVLKDLGDKAESIEDVIGVMQQVVHNRRSNEKYEQR